MPDFQLFDSHEPFRTVFIRAANRGTADVIAHEQGIVHLVTLCPLHLSITPERKDIIQEVLGRRVHFIGFD
jgi:hypothetical protein